jgi:hypothetical protein
VVNRARGNDDRADLGKFAQDVGELRELKDLWCKKAVSAAST